MKILVPTDFSPTASKALRYALDFPTVKKSKIILYHSCIPYQGGFISRGESENINKERAQQLKRTLKLTVNKIVKSYPNANIETYLDEGAETKSIVSYSTREDIDLVIMGTTGASGLKETIIGSAAADVLSESPCPVKVK